MNANSQKGRFFDRFRSHLPDIFYTRVPMPSFLETPLNLSGLFQKPNPKQKAKSQNAQNKKTGDKKNNLEGIITAGSKCLYAINNVDIEINSGTWIIGDIEYGATARAKGKHMGDIFVVNQIVFLKR